VRWGIDRKAMAVEETEIEREGTGGGAREPQRGAREESVCASGDIEVTLPKVKFFRDGVCA
jgi:hypothetical protein